MRSPGYIHSLLLTILYFQDASANCYLPNGTDRNVIANATEDNYQPCSNDGFSMCCRLWPLGDQTVDVCRSNGLCYNPGVGIIWRESCTDQTWKSPNCLKLCVGNEIGIWVYRPDFLVFWGYTANVGPWRSRRKPDERKWCDYHPL